MLFYLLAKMKTNLKLTSENIPLRCTFLAYLNIAA